MLAGQLAAAFGGRTRPRRPGCTWRAGRPRRPRPAERARRRADRAGSDRTRGRGRRAGAVRAPLARRPGHRPRQHGASTPATITAAVRRGSRRRRARSAGVALPAVRVGRPVDGRRRRSATPPARSPPRARRSTSASRRRWPSSGATTSLCAATGTRARARPPTPCAPCWQPRTDPARRSRRGRRSERESRRQGHVPGREDVVAGDPRLLTFPDG